MDSTLVSSGLHMAGSVAIWAGGFGLAIQFFKALPLQGAWAKAQPAIAVGFMLLGGVVCTIMAQGKAHDVWAAISDPWQWVVVVMAGTQGTSSGAQFLVKAMGFNPGHALVPITNPNS